MKQYQRRFEISRLTLLLLGALLCASAPAQTYTGLSGNWKAPWNIDGTNIIRFYLKFTGSGTSYTAAMDDLDDGYNNLVPDSITVSPPPVTVNFSSVGYIFVGTLNSNFTELTGTWSGAGSSWPLVFDHEPGVDQMQALTYSDATGTLPYRLFVPGNYNAGTSYPLVLFLHGSGERGTDNRAQVTGQTGGLAFLFNENQAQQPCFFAAPQCPTSGTWYDSARHSELVSLINTLRGHYNIDSNRVYVTGLSMGGAGTWDMLGLHPTMFAAGVPLSGFAGSLSMGATCAAAWGGVDLELPRRRRWDRQRVQLPQPHQRAPGAGRHADLHRICLGRAHDLEWRLCHPALVRLADVAKTRCPDQCPPVRYDYVSH
jgi:pimeloyl-ACP methyl ester carboxylesterase